MYFEKSLFPDLLEQSDPMGRFADYEHRGHGVWCIDDLPYRALSEDLSEQTSLAIIYDDERFHFERDRTGKRWLVEIKHHFYEYVTVETGWGSSRKKERKLRYYARIREKKFSTRDEAIDFAEKIVALFKRVRAKRGVDEN
ncbi:MAG: hypothetical protein U0930_05090 [Pirellulales bacterium]